MFGELDGRLAGPRAFYMLCYVCCRVERQVRDAVVAAVLSDIYDASRWHNGNRKSKYMHEKDRVLKRKQTGRMNIPAVGLDGGAGGDISLS